MDFSQNLETHLLVSGLIFFMTWVPVANFETGFSSVCLSVPVMSKNWELRNGGLSSSGSHV